MPLFSMAVKTLQVGSRFSVILRKFSKRLKSSVLDMMRSMSIQLTYFERVNGREGLGKDLVTQT